jgi:hypothetical protein
VRRATIHATDAMTATDATDATDAMTTTTEIVPHPYYYK